LDVSHGIVVCWLWLWFVVCGLCLRSHAAIAGDVESV